MNNDPRTSASPGRDELPDCPHCVDEKVFEINWRYAQDNPSDAEFSDYVRALQFTEKLKFGELYRCSKGGCEWFLDDNGIDMRFIEPDDRNLMIEWGRKKLRPTKKQLRKLLEIGASGADVYGGYADVRDFPCRCKTKAGEVLDYCIVRFQREPPLSHEEKRTILIDQVVEITECEFALSHEVREATLNAREIRMMYAPTVVENLSGDQFILNDRVYFFNFEGNKGQDIILAERGYDETDPMVTFDGSVYVWGNNESRTEPLPIILVVADWDDDYPEPFPKVTTAEGYSTIPVVATKTSRI